MQAPFVWIYVCFAAGILLTNIVEAPLWTTFAAGLIAAISLRGRTYAIALLAQSMFILLLANSLTAFQNKQYDHSPLRLWVREHQGETARVRGTLLRTPEIGEDYFVLIVRVYEVSRRPVIGTARVTVSGEMEEYPAAGENLETFIRLRLPENFWTEGAFDYQRYLRKERIDVLGSVKSVDLIHRKGISGISLRNITSRLRLRAIAGLQSLDAHEAAFLRALWLDDRSALTRSIEQALIDAGVYHVIAISGFHIAVLLILAFFVLKPFLHFRKSLIILASFLLFYYTLLEGRSSITRSLIMFLVFSLAAWKYEKPDWGTVLSVAGFLQILINPLELFDPGYHLTYLSTAAIVFLAAPICNYIPPTRAVYRAILNFVVVSIVVQVVLLPYQVFVFHRISLASLVANCIAVPLSSILIAAGTLALPAICFGFPAGLLLRPFLTAFIRSCEFFSQNGAVFLPQPSLYAVIIFYFAITVVILIRRPYFRLAFLCITAAGLALSVVPNKVQRTESLQVHFLDVGQGDAILIRYPDGSCDLVDAGGFWNPEGLDTGTSVVLPYLAHIGVQQLNRVFLTHAHSDHMNGLPGLLRYVPAQKFYVSRLPYGDASFRQFLQRVNRSPIGVHEGFSFVQAGVAVTVISPRDSKSTKKVVNDDSLVLFVEYAGRKLLLTGDAEKSSEEELRIGRIDALKIAHHGSKSSTSNTFLQQVNSKVAFVSVGRLNWFGHPHPSVLQRLRENHVSVFRTDQLGTIRLKIDADGMHINSFVWEH